MTKKIKVILAEPNNEISKRIESIIAKENDIKILTTTKSSSIALESVRKFLPDVLIISANSIEGDSFEVTKILANELPDLVIIMTAHETDAKHLRRAMKYGARDFILHDELENTLIKSMKEAVELIRTYRQKEETKDGKIVAFMSAKGGVGKSTIVTNTSIAIAQIFAEENKNKKICVVDYDLQFGDISFLTKIKPTKTLEELADKTEIDREMVDNIIYVNREYGIYVLPAPSRPEYDARISANVLIDLLNIVRTKYDLVIVDVIQGFQNATMATLKVADLACVVALPDLFNIKNAMLTFEALKLANIEKERVKYILNKYNSKKHLKKYDIETKIQKEIFHIFPKDDATAEQASDLGEPLVISYPRTALAKSYKVFAKKLLNYFYPDEYELETSIIKKLFK